jgi:nucleotide-binding universal stress UspA family protein
MNSILVGYDQTEASDLALERSAEIAQAMGAKLIVTSVAPTSVGGPRSAGPFDPADSPQRHAAELQHACELLAARGLEAECILAHGDPAHAIVHLAEEHNVDLIVVGSHEPRLIDRLLHGDVSRAVSHRAHRDVLVVHTHHEPRRHSRRATTASAGAKPPTSP